MATFSKRSMNNLEGIHPQLVRLMQEAICKTPIDFTITDGVRTAAQQYRLYLQGRDGNPGNIVTNCDGVTRKSNHQPREDGYGYAVDLYPYYNGSVQVNDVEGLRKIASHIKEVACRLGIRIEWGGDWSNLKDYPHFGLV